MEFFVSKHSEMWSTPTQFLFRANGVIVLASYINHWHRERAFCTAVSYAPAKAEFLLGKQSTQSPCLIG